MEKNCRTNVIRIMYSCNCIFLTPCARRIGVVVHPPPQLGMAKISETTYATKLKNVPTGQLFIVHLLRPFPNFSPIVAFTVAN
jgi:hypothetical protein